MSVWIGAKQIANDAANAIRRAAPGMEVNQGEFIAPEPLEQIVTTLIRCANDFDDYPDCGEFAQQYREIAFRWQQKGRPKTQADYDADYRIVAEVETEMMSRMMKEHGRS